MSRPRKVMSVLRKSPLPPPEKDNENEDAKDSDIEDSGFFLTTLNLMLLQQQEPPLELPSHLNLTEDSTSDSEDGSSESEDVKSPPKSRERKLPSPILKI